MAIDKKKCEWCGDLVPINTLEKSGGCDIIPGGLMICEECIDIPKTY